MAYPLVIDVEKKMKLDSDRAAAFLKALEDRVPVEGINWMTVNDIHFYLENHVHPMLEVSYMDIDNGEKEYKVN